MSEADRRAPGWGARLAALALGFAVAVFIVEIFFRVWAAAVAAPDAVPLPDPDHAVVLCIGDSHTWGAGAGYPARLAERLAERSDRYRVINFGVPGTNTRQLRERLDEQLDRYRPRLLVVWSGVNNAWRRPDAETGDGVAPPSLGERLARVSRIARFVRVWRHQRELDRLLEAHEVGVVPDASVEDADGARTYERRLGDTTTTFVNDRGGRHRGLELTRTTRDDLVWIVERAAERGVPTILVTYGLPGGRYGEASAGIREAAALTDAGLVEASRAGLDLMQRHRDRPSELPALYDATAHPTQALYARVGERILALADERGWLPSPPSRD